MQAYLLAFLFWKFALLKSALPHLLYGLYYLLIAQVKHFHFYILFIFGISLFFYNSRKNYSILKRKLLFKFIISWIPSREVSRKLTTKTNSPKKWNKKIIFILRSFTPSICRDKSFSIIWLEIDTQNIYIQKFSSNIRNWYQILNITEE